MNDAQQQAPSLGGFIGVFTPTVLTILGVIMYLRLGWVVGNAGFLGALCVIGLACAITLATALSVASIATNTRLGAGGPYAIIARSLGLEVAGSVGLPLYLAQALVISIYVFGFREGWLWIYPGHDPLVVDLVTFGAMVSIALVSARFAFRTQLLVMGLIVASLVSVVSVFPETSALEVPLWGDFRGFPEDGFRGAGFWATFAVFFPAVTGVLAGVNMSGELANPRRAIPIGMLSAVAVSSLVYLGMVYWLASSADAAALTSDYLIMVDRARWGPLVLAGLLGATFSSGLSSMVGAPRILAALAADGVIPGGKSLASRSASGEPRRAVVVTAVVAGAGLLARDLNTIAPLVTMFFLITYMVVNVVLVVESRLGLTSFRPSFRVPQIVPIAGAFGCVVAMVVVNPVFFIVAICVVAAAYRWILKRGVHSYVADVRSGLFYALAQWAAQRVATLPRDPARAWKPDLLIPVDDPLQIRDDLPLVADLCRPDATVRVLVVGGLEETPDADTDAQAMCAALRLEGVFATSAVVDEPGPHGAVAALQALGGAFFRPNVVWMRLPPDPSDDVEFCHLIETAHEMEIGAIVMVASRNPSTGHGTSVDLWIRPQNPTAPLADTVRLGNLNLASLLALRLHRAWAGPLTLRVAVDDVGHLPAATAFLGALRDEARMPEGAESRVDLSSFEAALESARPADWTILGLPIPVDVAEVRRITDLVGGPCLFVRDSGGESALV